MIKRLPTLLALSMVILSNVLCLAANTQDGVEVVSLSHTEETDAAMAFCREGLAPIPLSLQRKVADAGIKVVVTPRTIFDAPEQSGSQVFTNGGTTDNAGGFFQTNKNRILVPERAAWRNSPPRFQGRYIVSVVRHEFGHAFDHACGSISQQSEYLSVYKQDLSKLSSDQKIKFSYYITGVSKEPSADGTASGHGELFASMMCSICSKPPSAKDTNLMESFPHVRDYMLSLEPDLKTVSAASVQTARTIPKASAKTVAAAKSSASEVDAAPGNPDVDKASVLIQQHQFGEALRVLNGVIKSNPDDQKAHLLRGNDLSWLGRYREALFDYNAAIRLNRQDADAYLMRGRAYGWLGQKSDQQRDEDTAKRIGAGQTIAAP